MTDYLEMLFLPRGDLEQGGEEIPALRGLREEHEPEQMRKAVLTQDESERETSPKPLRDVEVFFESVTRPGEEPSLEEGERPRFSRMLRPTVEGSAEELERKLRRDSRRYDSGFYRY